MDIKHKKARMEMIKKLAKEKVSEAHSGLGEALKGKKLSKVEVIAKDEKGLEKGLSKAQEILKAKFGDKVDETEDESAEDEELCDACEGEGCPVCKEEQGEDEESILE